MFDVAIIGCGIVGASLAYRLARYDLKTVVLEAQNDVSMGTTKANSGIIHAGYDPAPGTLMAELNLQGNILARELCEKLHIPYKQIGSLVLAFSDTELQTVQKLYDRGLANGVPGLQILSSAQVKELEPNIADTVVGALYAPTAGVVSPWDYALAQAEVAVQNGVQLRLSQEVAQIIAVDEGYKILTNTGELTAKFVINAAGVHADKIHNMVAEPEFKILPNKGEYYLLDKEEGSRVNHVVFQCPSAVGKGVLVSPTAHGNLIVGPDAQDTKADDTATSGFGLNFVRQSAVKSVPNINFRANIRNFAGVRAASDHEDFIITFAKGQERFIDVAGIKSPGLTAAPAIAIMVEKMLAAAGLPLNAKQKFIDERPIIRFNELSAQQKAELTAKDPAYGRVICRCETITEGEIMAALHGVIPPVSVDGVKRRTNAGMGRCQGGFCGPRVLELIAKTQKRDYCEIDQDGEGTNILIGETKKRGAANV